jgi:hypothetical protein
MKIGDTILVEGIEGTVVEIALRLDGRYEIFYNVNGSVLHFSEGDKDYKVVVITTGDVMNNG